MFHPLARRLVRPAAGALLSLAAAVAVAAGDQRAAAPARDTSKEVIESPAKAAVARASASAAAGFVNPRVVPGRVRWHPTLAAACAAARKSGKPVLLFQMMGRLDRQFC